MSIQQLLRDRDIRQYLVLAIVVVNFSIAIVYANVRTFDVNNITETGYGDAKEYLAIYKNQPAKRLAWGPLVPIMARGMRDVPQSLLPMSRDTNSDRMAVMKFGMVNYLFLVATCFALYHFQLTLGMDFKRAFFGVILFLSCLTVVRGTGLPVADTAFFFFFVVSLTAVITGSIGFLLCAQVIGVFATELVVFMTIPAIMLSLHPLKKKGTLLLVSGIGVVLYWLTAPGKIPAVFEYIFDGTVYTYFSNQIAFLLSSRGIERLFCSFGFLWFPAIYAYFVCDIPRILKRWAWLIPIILIGILFYDGNFDRSLFTAFPVIIPLAALGLVHFLENTFESAQSS